MRRSRSRTCEAFERSGVISHASNIPSATLFSAPDDQRARSVFSNVWLHRLVGNSRLARAISLGVLAKLEMALLAGHKDHGILTAIRRATRGRESLLTSNEAFTLYSIARAQGELPGDMAEVGVYQGCSAKIISTASEGRPLHLFDTYAGLPSPSETEARRLRRGQYSSSLESVQRFLSGHDNVSFYEGEFPGTSVPVADRRFSFVHLDVDLKSSTLACLAFFYPRMVPGGIILTHDYSYLDGVRAAFDVFLQGCRERAIELPTSQAMLVKL